MKKIMTKPVMPNPPVCMPSLRILKITTCPSLSVRSTLTYHIGCTRQSMAVEETASDLPESDTDSDSPESQARAGSRSSAANPDLYLRLFDNSAAGFFSHEWISLEVIQQQFEKSEHGEKSITSQLLCPLFKGKSANTPAFLFAVLKSEGLVRAVKDAKRLYERVDPSAFMAEVMALMASGVDLKVEEKVVKEAKPAVTIKTTSDTAMTVLPATPQPSVPTLPQSPSSPQLSSSKPSSKKAGRNNRQGGAR